jgi:hypothetical protein
LLRVTKLSSFLSEFSTERYIKHIGGFPRR